MAYFECKKCGRRFEELKRLGKVEFCGDFWKCTDCDNDITKDLDSWMKSVHDNARLIGSILHSDQDNSIDTLDEDVEEAIDEGQPNF
jgi:protein-arginine kinase activator protein McsA